MEKYSIVDATPEDAPLIAWAVMEAVGDEIIAGLAEGRTRDDVMQLFTELARREHTQYSYRNTRIALSDSGQKVGVCVSYDGGNLLMLRRPFFREANRILGWTLTDEEIDALPGETGGEEYYLDSLAVKPGHRGEGIGSLLIDDAYKKALRARLPLGLLVADDNPKARRLYESLGFSPAGRRPFAGEEMTNLRKNI